MTYVPSPSELRGLAIGREVINKAWQLERAQRTLTVDEQKAVAAGVFLRKLAPYLGEDGLSPMTDEAWG